MLSKIVNISQKMRIGNTLLLIEYMAFACEGKNTVYRMFEDKPHSENYSKYRPSYPEELKQSILSYMVQNGYDNSRTTLTLDVGCGTGISTRLFSSSFTCCWGVDISHEQLRQAVSKQGKNELYLMSLAEKTCFRDSMFDLITVGQAWHWFDPDGFNEEVKRILAPNGFVAVFGYSFPAILKYEEAQKILYEFYMVTLAPYWSKRRQLVRSHYSSMSLPFEQKSRIDDLSISLQVTLDGLIGYVDSTSAMHLMNIKDPANTALKKLRQDLAVTIGGDDIGKYFNPILDIQAPLFVEIAMKTAELM